MLELRKTVNGKETCYSEYVLKQCAELLNTNVESVMALARFYNKDAFFDVLNLTAEQLVKEDRKLKAIDAYKTDNGCSLGEAVRAVEAMFQRRKNEEDDSKAGNPGRQE